MLRVSELGERLLERLGAAEHEDLAAIARRIATALVGLVRLLAVPTGAALMVHGGARTGTVLAVATIAAIWVVVSTRFDMRSGGPQLPLGAWAAGDAVLLMVGLALSGGVDSPLRLLILPTPIIAGLLLAPRGVALLGVALAVGYALLDTPGRPLAALALQLAWASALGAGVAHQRLAWLRRLEQIDTVRRAVVGGEPDGDRARLGAELRAVALAPLSDVAQRMPHASGAELETLAADVAEAAQRLRSVVVELHVLTARQGGLRGALEGLVQRCSPEARLVLELPGELEPDEVSWAADLTREALRAVAGRQTDELAITLIRRAGGALVLEVDAAPAPDGDAARWRARAFGDHAALHGGRMAWVEGGNARAVLEDENPSAVPRWIPGRSLPDARTLIALARIPTALAVLGTGLVIGGVEPAFYWAVAGLLLWAPVAIRWVSDPSTTFLRFVLLTAPDVALLSVLASSAGTARSALQPVAVAIAPCYGVVLSPALTLLTDLVVGAALALGGAGAGGVAIAYTWSVIAAVLLAVGVASLNMGMRRLARIRRRLVRHLAAEQQEERRALAERLHDDTLQVLLATRQDLEEAARGDEAARELAAAGILAAVVSLRRVAGDLDTDPDGERLPGGPHAALQELADELATRGGPALSLDLEAGATGHQDGLVVRLARELISNAVKHAEADHVSLHVGREADLVVLEVADDGRGVDPARLRDAVERGHIGLASCRERIAVAGGSLALEPVTGGGTLVRATLPVRRDGG